MENFPEATPRAVPVTERAYYQARVAAAINQKSLGDWLEEAIIEKVHREHRPPVQRTRGGGPAWSEND